MIFETNLTIMTRFIRQWWTQSNPEILARAQDDLLRRFIRSATFRRNQKVAGINSVTFETQTQSARTVVLAHGFGSGLGFFVQNIDGLLASGVKVVTVDWLGMGGSDRPVCRSAPIRWSWCESGLTATQAVDFFIDPFHEWMQDIIDDTKPVTLMGHSLGGYLAARYALKYHNDSSSILDKLILASPVGFAKPPPNQFVGSQFPTVSLRVIDALWSSNVTPQQLVRLMGATRGRQNVQRALRARMPHLPDSDVEILAEYLFHITVADPSGEFAMNSLLEPVASPDTMGVFAREPLYDPIQTLLTPKIRVLYGDNDWMRPSNETSARKAFKTAGNGSVEIVPNAGHHLYLENSSDFVRHIVS